MALIKEDGSIISNADSYITLTEANDYWINHGNPVLWSSATDSEKEAAIRYATQFIESSYSFKGSLISTEQPLSFPRTAFYDREGRILAGEGVIPKAIKDASAELALRHLDNNLFFQAQQAIGSIKKEKVGDHEVEFSDPSESLYTKKNTDFIMNLLRNYISGTFRQLTILKG